MCAARVHKQSWQSLIPLHKSKMNHTGKQTPVHEIETRFSQTSNQHFRGGNILPSRCLASKAVPLGGGRSYTLS